MKNKMTIEKDIPNSPDTQTSAECLKGDHNIGESQNFLPRVIPQDSLTNNNSKMYSLQGLHINTFI